MLNITARQDLMRIIFDTISVVVEEARLDFSENDLEIRVVDPSHVAMIRMNVDSAAFESWEVDETFLGLELVKMRDLLSLGNAGDLIEMKHDDEEGRINLSMGKIDRVIRPLDHSTMSPPNVPDLELPASVTLSGEDLSRALRAVRLVGDLVNISLSEEGLAINVTGGDTDSVSVMYTKDEVQELKCDGAVSSQYSLTYLLPISRLLSVIDSVTLRFGDNFPLKIEYEFANGAANVTYFLAPRIEGDI
jgi:proliferating cell nuclear antigen